MMDPLYTSVGFDDSAEDPHLDQHKRVLVLKWACRLGHQNCVEKSVSLYKMWMRDPDNKR